MPRLLIKILLACILMLVFVVPDNALAKEQENNKFGIHIIDEHDLKDAASLVNSNGGQWGYVTFVIREDQRNVEQWQRVMDEMRRLKLIPIVRLATKMEDAHWTIPTEAEAVNWAGFLNSLNWPTKNRYVVLFNEPNHAKEWGGTLDPALFARIYRHYYQTLKDFSSDFFVMPAALDLAATNTAETMEASLYFEKMHDEDNFIFTLFDGLNSHSYPNPGFSGSPTDTGKTSIGGYKWELTHLVNMGLPPDTPVFITETGWIRGSGNLEENYKLAYENVWSDPQVVAVTPFVLSYLDRPFDNFSWKNPETREFYPQYYSVQSITKNRGEPTQIHSFEVMGNSFADYLVSESEYSFYVELKNTGQSIWSKDDGFTLSVDSTMKPENIIVGEISYTEPKQTAKINIRLKTLEPRGIHSIKLALTHDDQKIGDLLTIKFTLVSPPTLTILANFWFGEDSNNFANLKMYDQQTLVNTYENIAFEDGHASIPAVKNIIPNRDYRFILSKPFFVPSVRQAKLYIGTVDIDFGRLLPLDLNSDGSLDFTDALAYVLNPMELKLRLLNF